MPPKRQPKRGQATSMLVLLGALYVMYFAGFGRQVSGMARRQLQVWQGAPTGPQTFFGDGFEEDDPALLASEELDPLERKVQDALMAAADVDYAISLPAKVHGFVRKWGPTKLHHWTSGNRTARHQHFKRWMSATGAHPDGAKAAVFHDKTRLPNLAPVYPNCQVLINHRYKVIYVRHPKSAATAVTTFFGICPPNRPSITEAERAEREGLSGTGGAGTWLWHWLRGGRSYEQGAACLEPMSTMDLPPEEIERIWREYFVFTVVRNPYQRMLSTWKFMIHKTKADPECKNSVVSWGEHCADPLAIGRHCAAHPKCCIMQPGYYWQHVVDQGRCLTTEEGNWAVDYVATVEKFNEQVPALLAEINRRRPYGLPELGEVTHGDLVYRSHAEEDTPPGCRPDDMPEDEVEPPPQLVKTEVAGHMVEYNATVLPNRLCQDAEYFRVEFEHCLLQARHYYSVDFERLYPLRRHAKFKRPGSAVE